MPRVAKEINDLYAAVIRPTALTIIEDIKKLSGFPKNAKVIMLGGLGRAIQPNSAIGEVAADVGGTDFLLQFSLEEETLDDTVGTNTVFGKDQHPVFLDSVLGINIKPLYTQAEFVLNIKSRFPDQNSAIKWRNEFRRYTMQGRKTYMHTASYHYPLPTELLIILIELHRLRERKSPYGDSLEKYVREHIGFNVTTVTDISGGNGTLAVAETQANLVGHFDFSVQPEPAEIDKEKGTWEINFVYKYRMDKPIECVMHYPFVVHNQLLSDKFRPDTTYYSLEKELQHPSIQNALLNNFRKLHPGERRGLAGISYPQFDDWLPDIRSPFHSDMLRLWIRVAPADRRNVLSLEELGDYELDPLLIAYLKSRPAGLSTIFNGAVHLRLYKNQEPLEEPALSVDSNLNVVTAADMDSRSVYHLIVAITTDLTLLSPAAQEHLRTFGSFVLAIVDAIYPNLNSSDYTLLSDGSLKRSDFVKIINDGKDYYRLNGSVSPDFANPTIGLYTIVNHGS